MPASIAQSVALCGTIFLMELHGIRPEARRKEIQCEDCAHTYLVAEGQQSSRCDVCGNIAFHASSAQPLKDLARSPMALIREKVLSRMSPEPVTARVPEANPLDAFKTTPDGARVQDLLVKYQVEWQLWAMLVKHFQDPAYHAAYLSHVTMAGEFDRATARYREHRAVMALLRENHWQADVSDLMLSRLEVLAEVQARAESRKGWRLPEFWMHTVPYHSRIIKYGWFIFGFIAVCRLAMALS